VFQTDILEEDLSETCGIAFQTDIVLQEDVSETFEQYIRYFLLRDYILISRFGNETFNKQPIWQWNHYKFMK